MGSSGALDSTRFFHRVFRNALGAEMVEVASGSKVEQVAS